MSRRRVVPFQTSLGVNLVAGVLLLGAVLWVTAHLALSRAVESLSDELTRRVMTLTEARLQGFVEPITYALNVLELRMASGAYDTLDPDGLDPALGAILQALPQVSSVLLAFDDGSEYMLLSTEEGWRSRVTRPIEWPGQALVREWTSGAAPPAGELQTVDYDSLARPWNQGARERLAALPGGQPVEERIHWTNPYQFFTTKQPGITASLALTTPSGRVGVVALDVLLADVSTFTIGLTEGRRSKAFIVRGDVSDPVHVAIIGLPADPRFAGHNDAAIERMVLSSPPDLGGPVAAFLDAGVEDTGGVQSYESGGEHWWGAISASEVRLSDDIWVGAAIPASELLEELPDLRVAIAAVTVLLVFVAALRARRLARLYATPLGGLVRRGERLQRLDFRLSEKEDSTITEIRQLGSTLETARQTLEAFHAEREDARVARSVRAMLEPDEVAAPPGWSLAVWHESSPDVEGELADVATAADGTVALLLADLPGSGVRAAVDGAQVRAAFRACVGEGFDPLRAAAVLQRLAERDLSGRTFRLWLGALDPASGELLSVDRGLQPAWIGATARAREDGLAKTLIAPGDRLCLASDGVTDALDETQLRFGADGVATAVGQHVGHDAAGLVGAVRQALQPFGVDTPRDRTLLVIVRGPHDDSRNTPKTPGKASNQHGAIADTW